MPIEHSTLNSSSVHSPVMVTMISCSPLQAPVELSPSSTLVFIGLNPVPKNTVGAARCHYWGLECSPLDLGYRIS
jgi:hypothetical protein